MKKLRFIILVCIAFISSTISAQSQRELGELMRNRGEYYFTLSVNNPSEIQAISDLCSVDGTDGRIVVCYANQQEYDKLLQSGYHPDLMTPPSLREEAKMWEGGDRATYAWDSYPTYSQYESMMQGFPLSAVSGRNCTYLELGTLNSGRKIMGIRINNGDTTGKPKFLYSSTIHGDETTGWILLLRLIDELCTSTDSRIVNLIDNLDIFVFPNTNPDGTYYGGNNTVSGARRANANNIDMNRNYPDPHSSQHPDNNAWQTETQWFMQLAEDYPFTMAANYHGGAEIVNYPWDNTKTRHADDAWWQYVSSEYANLCHAVSSSYMTTANNQGDKPSGITNGADWYMIGGGRQDYMNGYRQCREVTIECSNTKTPNASQLPTFWNYNHNGMLAYMEQCLKGVHGFVYDATTHQSLDGVTITVMNHDDEFSIVSTHEDGDFHRPIKGGTWTLMFSKGGYHSETVNVTVADGERLDISVYLRPIYPDEMNCYEQVQPSSSGDYVMAYVDGDTFKSPSHNNSSTVTTASLDVTPTDNGFSLAEETTVPQFTLTAYQSGRYYISYNGRYLSRSGSSLTWSTTQPSNGRWYINNNGIYVTSSSSWSTTTYYLYFNGTNFALSTSQLNNIHFYEQGECPTPVYTKDIIGYTANAKDRYYLIASPIGTVSPEQVGEMLDNNYDLYYFEQNPGDNLEWRNYDADNGNNHFDLMYGKGYLYANSQDVTLNFIGAPYHDDGVVTLRKTDNVRFAGWNLVGNPFAQTAYITRPFYTMNEFGTEIIAGSGNSVNAMEGIFVIAESDGETMTFSTIRPNAKADGQIVVNVSQGTTTLDRAIVRIGEGNFLPKFMLNKSNTKIYINQEDGEYAVVRAANAEVIPVSFEAAYNGMYSINVNVEDSEVSYLHLIDCKTGVDIDLIQTPNYSFESTKDDNASRFKLVFVTTCEGEDGDNAFAFFTNDNWIISNDGEAVLQVIDINGRILSSEEIHGSTSKHIDAAPGVYMLRLVKGDDVKMQKIVVR